MRKVRRSMVRMKRWAKPEQANPSSGKTLTITITAPVRVEQFREDSARLIDSEARELARHLKSYLDPDQVTVTISYDYPQWRRVYEPDVSS
jgi:hypothetical protein